MSFGERHPAKVQPGLGVRSCVRNTGSTGLVLLWALTGVPRWSPRSWWLQLLFEEINGGLWVSPHC